MEKEEFQKIAEKLIELGEDNDEMQYWINIYDDLPQQQKDEASRTFKEELQKLESL